MSAGQIADRFTVTRPAVSQHLRVLRRAGLLHERRSGRRRYYRVRLEGFEGLRKFLDGFWSDRLARLKSIAEKVEREQS